MFPQFQMVRDFDLYEAQPEEYRRCSALIFHKEEFLKETQENEPQNQDLGKISRSAKTRSDSLQTTFDENLLKQHMKAFRKISEGYLRNCFPHGIEGEATFKNCSIFGNEPLPTFGKVLLRDLLIKDSRLFDEKEKKTFLADLYFEEKLNEFLSEICSSCHMEVTLELAYIANLVWRSYIPHQEIGMSEEQIEKLIEDLLREETCEQHIAKLHYLGLEKSQAQSELGREEIENHLKCFLKQFGTTILLVVEEYFKNPFIRNSESTSAKRTFNFKDISNDSFSEDEEEYNFMGGSKKRKL